MADKGKGKLNDEGDERSVNRKRKHTSVLDVLKDDVEVMENVSNVEVFNDAQINNESIGTIFIKTPYGKILSFQVKGSDTIGSIKLKIQTEEFIPLDEQELIFNGMVLHDINTFANSHIKDFSTLILVHKAWVIDILIKNLEGRIIYYLNVKPTDTIASVKAQISTKEGTSVDEQVLIFNKMVLGDNGTLFDFHIRSKSTLTLIRKSRGLMNIFIKNLNGEIITEEVKPCDSIGSIKARIQDKVQIPYDEQELIFNETVLHSINTLAHYDIEMESTITLRRLSREFMQIFVKTLSGTTFTLDVQPLDTIDVIKSNIQDNAHIHKVNIPYDKQELIFKDMVLHNNDTIEDYNIIRESTLTLLGISTGFVQIFIKIHMGKTITLDVKPSDTIADMKDKISCKEGYSPLCQVLTFNKMILEDGATVAFYNIGKESTVHLFIK